MYATVADMQARYGAQLVALAGTTADKQVDLAAVERALTAACAEMDLVLSVRYAVPIGITPVPPVLRRIAEDLAASALPRNGASEASMYERRAREARDLLDKLAAGKAELGAGASPAQPSGQSTRGGIAYHAPSSDFRRKLEDL